MNRTIISGRLTRDPEVRYTDGANGQKAIARYTIAVDRRGQDAGADFIPCVAFGNSAEFAEKYLKKGTKMIICGRIQTGSYTKQDGTKVYTTDVIVEEQEFAESKSSGGNAPAREQKPVEDANGFMQLDDLSTDELPWN